MPAMKIVPVIDKSVRGLCSHPYPNHPHGCPNFGKRSTCPPHVPLIEDVIDLSLPVYAIWNVFNFESHIQKMSALHPDWSRRQIECCLYWQGTARKQLQNEIQVYSVIIPNLVIKCPEAMGVNITETMRGIGEILEWPPVTKTYQVAIAGVRNHA